MGLRVESAETKNNQSHMNKTLVIVIIAIIVVVGGVFIFSSNKTQAPKNEFIDTSKIPPLVGENPTPTQPVTPKTITVEYGANGFSPASIEINVGDTVAFINKSTSNFWPASNPHPTHTDYPEFDAKKNITPGETYSFTFTKTGTWGYHNHKNPAEKSTVIVK